MKRAASLLAALLVAACGQGPRPADAPIRLTYGSPFSANHPFSQADKAWIAEVERRSGGRLHIEPYWGGSIVSTDYNVTELRHGLVDIGVISPIYARSGMTLVKAQSGFYGGVTSVDGQVAALRCAWGRFPELASELHGVHVLAFQGGALITLVTRDRDVRTLSDLRGLRIRAPSELLPVLRPLGVDVLAMPMGDVYSALSKGIVDGVIAPPDTLKTFHFGEVARFVTGLTIARGAYPGRAIRDPAWRRLPPDLQQLLAGLEPYWEAKIRDGIEAAQQEGLAAGRQDRVTFQAASPAEQAHFDALYQASALATARALDREGLPGGAILTTLQAVIHTGRCPAR